jgi:hypothetical protein
MKIWRPYLQQSASRPYRNSEESNTNLLSSIISHFNIVFLSTPGPGSSLSILYDYRLDGMVDPWQRQRIFPLVSASRPALGPTQITTQWLPGALSPGIKRGRGVMLTTHPLLVLRLRKSRSYTCCHPNAPLWSLKEPLYLLFTFLSTLFFP